MIDHLPDSMIISPALAKTRRPCGAGRTRRQMRQIFHDMRPTQRFRHTKHFDKSKRSTSTKNVECERDAVEQDEPVDLCREDSQLTTRRRSL